MNVNEEGADKIGIVAYRTALVCAIVSTSIAVFSISQHLKHYRRPMQQRLVVRIQLLVPVCAISAYTSLSAHAVADYVDTLRELYEAFVVYSFFGLLLNYMGGERALLTAMLSRLRTRHMFPFNLLWKPLDLSDPDTLLLIRRGVLQFIIIKPLLAVFIFLMKITGNYKDGYIALDSSYMWIALFYNISVFWAMYSLLMVYITCSIDLKPFKPFPKFLCIKALVFFSFWQGLIISFLVAWGIIRSKGEYSANNIATALQDFLICFEALPFSIAYLIAFPSNPYLHPHLGSRLPLSYAIRDVVGGKDVYMDAYHTITGTTFGVDYYDSDNEQEIEEEEWEIDPAVEDGYKKARELVFGDYNYPVINDLIIYHNPPVVSQRIESQADLIIEEIESRRIEKSFKKIKFDKGGVPRYQVGASSSSNIAVVDERTRLLPK